MMTRRVIEELRRLNETHGFLRGLVAYVGYKQASSSTSAIRGLAGKAITIR